MDAQGVRDSLELLKSFELSERVRDEEVGIENSVGNLDVYCRHVRGDFLRALPQARIDSACPRLPEH